jgi:hypothetical protein
MVAEACYKLRHLAEAIKWYLHIANKYDWRKALHLKVIDLKISLKLLADAKTHCESLIMQNMMVSEINCRLKIIEAKQQS